MTEDAPFLPGLSPVAGKPVYVAFDGGRLTSDAGVAAGTKLRHDHGSQFVANDFQAKVAFLGLESSPAFVREPEGNGCAERFIRVLKENLLWRFDTVGDLRHALHAFKDAYKEGWILPASRLPNSRPGAHRADRIAHGRLMQTPCLISVDR